MSMRDGSSLSLTDANAAPKEETTYTWPCIGGSSRPKESPMEDGQPPSVAAPMSGTPRTDREVYTIRECDIGFEAVGASLARQLERELNFYKARDKQQNGLVPVMDKEQPQIHGKVIDE